MSLILEALRKSEAERRRGQTPDLLTDALPVALVARRRTPNWPVLLPVAGAALITLLLVLWWLRPSAERVPDGTAANDASLDAQTGNEPASTPLDAATVQAPPDLPAPAIRSSAPSATPATLTPPAPAPVASATDPAATTQAPTPPPAEAKPATALPTPAQVASLEPLPPPVSANTPAFASPDAPVKLSDLSAEDRAQLPTLKVSMHMWAPDAGSRFAIIDGARVNEGDRVGEAMVEAIQPDSVMLSWRGRQVRLPIR